MFLLSLFELSGRIDLQSAKSGHAVRILAGGSGILIDTVNVTDTFSIRDYVIYQIEVNYTYFNLYEDSDLKHRYNDCNTVSKLYAVRKIAIMAGNRSGLNNEYMIRVTKTIFDLVLTDFRHDPEEFSGMPKKYEIDFTCTFGVPQSKETLIDTIDINFNITANFEVMITCQHIRDFQHHRVEIKDLSIISNCSAGGKPVYIIVKGPTFSGKRAFMEPGATDPYVFRPIVTTTPIVEYVQDIMIPRDSCFVPDGNQEYTATSDMKFPVSVIFGSINSRV